MLGLMKGKKVEEKESEDKPELSIIIDQPAPGAGDVDEVGQTAEKNVALHQATKVVVAQLLYRENNPSLLLSSWNAKLAILMGLLGTFVKHQIENEGVAFQAMCDLNQDCWPPAEWSSPTIVRPDDITFRGNWNLAAGAGLLLMFFTYFAAGVFNGRQLVERFAADRACREPLTPEAKKNSWRGLYC